MNKQKLIQGFSNLSHDEKLEIVASITPKSAEFKRIIKLHHYNNTELQNFYNDFAENTISNFFMPYCIAPNFKINEKIYMVPMVIEESSVVAAASAAAKFWWHHGGFDCKVIKTIKPGHIHFLWNGEASETTEFINSIIPGMFESVKDIETEMKKRGGGIKSIDLIDSRDKLEGYFEVEVLFDTSDAMGANYINTCLEKISTYILLKANEQGISYKIKIIMSVLSNYTPECLVKVKVSCKIRAFENISALSSSEFVQKFETAVKIAHININRAVTHNKGIFNGVDAVLLATGNDFRAVEAAGHSWAAKDGNYRSLSNASINGANFEFQLEMPMPVGVVGGITNIHPLAKASIQLLGNPSAKTLMFIAASVGLANNFSAVKALVSNGIQSGHMKLHLNNILKLLEANEAEKKQASDYFQNKTVNHKDVIEFIKTIRSEKSLT